MRLSPFCRAAELNHTVVTRLVDLCDKRRDRGRCVGDGSGRYSIDNSGNYHVVGWEPESSKFAVILSVEGFIIGGIGVRIGDCAK
jgi:hypothetical protein